MENSWKRKANYKVFLRVKHNPIQIKASLYSQYYAKACNEWRDPSPRLSTNTQKRRSGDQLLTTVSDSPAQESNLSPPAPISLTTSPTSRFTAPVSRNTKTYNMSPTSIVSLFKRSCSVRAKTTIHRCRRRLQTPST